MGFGWVFGRVAVEAGHRGAEHLFVFFPGCSWETPTVNYWCACVFCLLLLPPPHPLCAARWGTWWWWGRTRLSHVTSSCSPPAAPTGPATSPPPAWTASPVTRFPLVHTHISSSAVRLEAAVCRILLIRLVLLWLWSPMSFVFHSFYLVKVCFLFVLLDNINISVSHAIVWRFCRRRKHVKAWQAKEFLSSQKEKQN